MLFYWRFPLKLIISSCCFDKCGEKVFKDAFLFSVRVVLVLAGEYSHLSWRETPLWLPGAMRVRCICRQFEYRLNLANTIRILELKQFTMSQQHFFGFFVFVFVGQRISKTYSSRDMLGLVPRFEPFSQWRTGH